MAFNRMNLPTHFLTTRDASIILGMSIDAVQGAIDRGALPAVRGPAGRWRLSADAVANYRINHRPARRGCPRCGHAFTQTRSNQSYCSDRCQRRAAESRYRKRKRSV